MKQIFNETKTAKHPMTIDFKKLSSTSFIKSKAIYKKSLKP